MGTLILLAIYKKIGTNIMIIYIYIYNKYNDNIMII